MKRIITAILLLVPITLNAQQGKVEASWQSLNQRGYPQWFSDARLGIFVHWGLYASFAQGEWYLEQGGLDEAEYAKEKAELETRYSFRTEPLHSKDTAFDPDAKELDPVFDIGNDHFRFIMPNDEYDGYCGDFFKGCTIVVTNDEEHEIAYIVFKDQDLDVADDLTEFVNDTCGWKYVR